MQLLDKKVVVKVLQWGRTWTLRENGPRRVFHVNNSERISKSEDLKLNKCPRRNIIFTTSGFGFLRTDVEIV
jgi:hypothetical protein